MQIEIITTGEEVLSGQITDTNASWMSTLLIENGLPVSRRISVGDRMDDLIEVFQERSKAADVIIVNGGLGPTTDDMSSEAAGKALGEKVVLFPQWVKAMEARFKQLNRAMAESNLKQARLPESAEILDNPIGTACGFVIRLNRARLYFTPGVPSEMKRMMREQVLPHIRANFTVSTSAPLQRLHTFGISESRLNDMLQVIPLPKGISLGYRASMPYLEVKVMGLSNDLVELTTGMNEVSRQIREIIGPNLVFENGQGVEARIQELMLAKGYSLSLAESCTGGMVASRLVEVPGSSAYLDRGNVTYSNQAKTDMLDVPAEMIETHGAVSAEVARAMAEGAVRRSGSSHALSITGVAGPGGGTEAKPVGTVAFALAAPEGVYVQMLLAPGRSRNWLRTLSATAALDMLRRHLCGLTPFGDYDFIRADFREVYPSVSTQAGAS